MNAAKLKNHIQSGGLNDCFSRLYSSADEAESRYIQLIEGYEKQFSSDHELSIFSTPGRTELGGNHTDHQRGRVLAAAVDLDIIAAVSPNGSDTINIKSENHSLCTVRLSELSPVDSEKGRSTSLLRGICSKIASYGYKLSGFNAYTTSQVLSGSGLSSSAAFEICVSGIINQLFCDSKLTAAELAVISQYAENVYFDKPSGLMDQMACSVGGLCAIDFSDKANPLVESVSFDIEEYRHHLVIVNTGASHSDLTDDYAFIPADMRTVAAFFQKEVLREVSEDSFYNAIPELRQKVSDRAILRAMHFFADNSRVPRMVQAAVSGDFKAYLNEVNTSGLSSSCDLQNIYSCSNPNEQSIAIALSISRRILNTQGAVRVHGGGFAGTIQAYVPFELISAFKAEMEAVFGRGCCCILKIRNCGCIKIV